MHANTTSPSLTVFDVQIIRSRVRRAVGRAGLRQQDMEDLHQDCLYALCRRGSRFTSGRSPRPAFVATVAAHAIADIVEYRNAARRDWRRLRAFVDDNAEVMDGGLLPREAALPDDVHALRLRTSRLSSADRRDLRIDLRAALDCLPPDLKDVSERLMVSTPTEVARDLGIGRATVYDRMRATREFFLRHGLGIYLAPSAREVRA